MNPRFTVALAAASVAALALSACGSNSLNGDQGPSSAPSTSVSANNDLAAKLPAKVKTAGKLIIGTDPTYAPNEFSKGKDIVGSEVDLFKLVAAKFGVKPEFQAAKFGTLIPGVTSGKYDMSVSSFTINAERKKEVTMVSYYSSGTIWATAAGNPKGVDPQNPCGKTIAVQNNTTQQLDDLPARQKKCGANKINILPYDGQDQATAAVATGKADAMLADSPVVAYAIKQSGGKLQQVGDLYASAPFGAVLPKDETDFAQAIADALTSLQKDGSYEASLKRWGTEVGAVDKFEVNP
jgi:polar amino acid transport system substrate-binding protein